MGTISPEIFATFDRAKKSFIKSISLQLDNLFGGLLDDLKVQLEVDPEYLTKHSSLQLAKKQALSQQKKVILTQSDKDALAIENQTADDAIATKLSQVRQAKKIKKASALATNEEKNGNVNYIKGESTFDSSMQIEKIECMPEIDGFIKNKELDVLEDGKSTRGPYKKRPSRQQEYPCKHKGCKKVFRHSAELNIHMRIHLGHKPYVCKWPNCKYRARQLGGITTHVRLRHLKLPKSQKEQHKMGIVDARNPREWIEVHHELL